ncbi:MAG: hypothetical protein ACK5MN_07130 [Lachnospiraceae bacterium]
MIRVEYVNFEDMVEQAKVLVSLVGGASGSVQIPDQVPVQNTPIQQPTDVPAVGQAPVQNTPVQQPTAVPTGTMVYTLDDLQVAANTLLTPERTPALQGLLQNFGITSLPDLAPEQYGAFATALRGLGASI